MIIIFFFTSLWKELIKAHCVAQHQKAPGEISSWFFQNPRCRSSVYKLHEQKRDIEQRPDVVDGMLRLSSELFTFTSSMGKRFFFGIHSQLLDLSSRMFLSCAQRRIPPTMERTKHFSRS